MERLVIEIGVVIVVYVAGYKMGFKACYEYLKELKKYIDNSGN